MDRIMRFLVILMLGFLVYDHFYHADDFSVLLDLKDSNQTYRAENAVLRAKLSTMEDLVYAYQEDGGVLRIENHNLCLACHDIESHGNPASREVKNVH